MILLGFLSPLDLKPGIRNGVRFAALWICGMYSQIFSATAADHEGCLNQVIGMFQARVEQARVQRRPYTLNFIEIAKQLRECGVEDPHEVEPLLRSEKYRDVAVFAVMGLSSTNYKPSAIAIGDLRDTIRRTGLANPGETEVAALQLVGCCGPPLDNVPF